MNIVVLGGSPKGDCSVTMQYAHYLQRKLPEHSFEVVQISSRIRSLEKSESAFGEVIDKVRTADLVVWAFPVYFMLVPYQYKRFIELVLERNAAPAFAGKFAAVLTTSVKFFDHTAAHYMHALCDDLDMRFVGAYSANMYDLLESEERQRFDGFARMIATSIAEDLAVPRLYPPLKAANTPYAPGTIPSDVDAGQRKVLVLTDAREGETNLQRMTESFCRALRTPVEVANLWDLHIKGGCLGCIHCGYDNQCVYRDKDDFVKFYETRVKTADILIFAGAIYDRFLSSRWKLFLDRSFYNNHVPTLTNKQIGYIISGPLSQYGALQEHLAARITIQRANLVGFVTDELESSEEIDARLHNLAQRCVTYAGLEYIAPTDFLAEGGRKIFRDMLWGGLYLPFQADHRYYKANGIYDFPREPLGQRLRNEVMARLCRFPGFREEFRKRMKGEMIKPLEAIVTTAGPASSD